MAFDRTVIEDNMDAGAQQFVEDFRGESQDIDPDLAVDGLSESVLSRLFALFGVGRQ